MFLHELSRVISDAWDLKVDGAEYEALVRECFDNCCPYCSHRLAAPESVVEHLDGMNKSRAGLHVPGNVLVACKRCNGEKRRDDSKRVLSLGTSGWESFLSHDGNRCDAGCPTCQYWANLWPDESERQERLGKNLERIRLFRKRFGAFEGVIPTLHARLPEILEKLYSDCQMFAEREIASLLEQFRDLQPLD